MQEVQRVLMDFFVTANGFLWGWLMIWFLLGTGVYYSVRLGFPQFRLFFHMWRATFTGRTEGTGGLSPFQAVCTSLASQIGTGNLAGVATAIVAGGPGAIFWMWMTALVGMATILAETTLAQVFRVESPSGELRGGPAYYIDRGLGQKWLALLFAISIIAAMPFVFSAVHSNAIASSISGSVGIPKSTVALGLMAVTGLVIFGGLKRIASVAEVTVPFMAGIYILAAIFVIATNLEKLPDALALIFKSAFGAKQAAGGVLGYTITQAFRYGVARGLFSNEAGMGSTPVINATANVPHPARQGVVAMTAVFIDTILICTATAAIILLSGATDSEHTGIELTQFAMQTMLGSAGPLFLSLAILFFAWTSILGCYYIGESNIAYIFPKLGGNGLTVYRVIVLGMLFFGAVSGAPLVWEMADFFNGLMAMINLIAILLLSGTACKVVADYSKQYKQGNLNPTASASFIQGFLKKK
jgi:AGCS family alanine or glycine:cation symporter